MSKLTKTLRNYLWEEEVDLVLWPHEEYTTLIEFCQWCRCWVSTSKQLHSPRSNT